MANMPDKIPPLPTLPITWGTAQKTDQATVDIVLQQAYEERPDLIRKLCVCELNIENGIKDESNRQTREEVLRYLHDTFLPKLGYPHASIVDEFAWELRLRIRKMLNLAVSIEEVRALNAALKNKNGH